LVGFESTVTWIHQKAILAVSYAPIQLFLYCPQVGEVSENKVF
jgi:hypothetical protein